MWGVEVILTSIKPQLENLCTTQVDDPPFFHNSSHPVHFAKLYNNKINLNLYFHFSLSILKRFYESLEGL